ncbi:uncharacterized protein LOC144377975 isoform X2 [Ictidomys tridecemlineatus]
MSSSIITKVLKSSGYFLLERDNEYEGRRNGQVGGQENYSHKGQGAEDANLLGVEIDESPLEPEKFSQCSHIGLLTSVSNFMRVALSFLPAFLPPHCKIAAPVAQPRRAVQRLGRAEPQAREHLAFRWSSQAVQSPFHPASGMGIRTTAEVPQGGTREGPATRSDAGAEAGAGARLWLTRSHSTERRWGCCEEPLLGSELGPASREPRSPALRPAPREPRSPAPRPATA